MFTEDFISSYFFFFVRLNVLNSARGYVRAVSQAVLVFLVALLQSYVIDSAIVLDDASTFTWNITETMMYGEEKISKQFFSAGVCGAACIQQLSATHRKI